MQREYTGSVEGPDAATKPPWPRGMTRGTLLPAVIAALCLVLWSFAQLTRSPAFIDETANIQAGSALLDSFSHRRPGGIAAAHVRHTTGPTVTVPAALAFRASGDLRVSRLTKYGWLALLGITVVGFVGLTARYAPGGVRNGVAGLALLALAATPHHIIEIPQILGETAAVALVLAGLCAYLSMPRLGPLGAGALIALASATKLLVSPIAALLALGLLLFDRRSLLPYTAGAAAVWLCWSAIQAWQVTGSVIQVWAAQVSLVRTGQGSGGSGSFVFDPSRFVTLEYATWPPFLQTHLWLYGLTALVLTGIVLRAISAREQGNRRAAVALGLALFVLVQWAWFTWINDTMWIRHATLGWLLLGPLAVSAYYLASHGVARAVIVSLLLAHVALGGLWLAYPRHAAALLVTDPAAWWGDPLRIAMHILGLPWYS